MRVQIAQFLYVIKAAVLQNSHKQLGPEALPDLFLSLRVVVALPAIQLVIDLHRDAYLDGMETAVVDSNGARLAPLMMLIGNGVGFTDKPYYEENLAFAQALTERINALQPNLCKKVLVKDGRYNQSIGVFSILIEVGHNRNTLREALASLPDLADGLQSLMISDPDAKLEAMQRAGS